MRATAAISLFLLLTSHRAFAKPIQVGDRAPTFALKTAAGSTVDLKTIVGAKVIVVDFAASWCKPCAKELPKLDALAAAYAKGGDAILVIAVDLDDNAPAAWRFFKKLGLGALTGVADPRHAAVGLYDPDAMPTSYVIDCRGIIRAVISGSAGVASIDEAARGIKCR